MTQLMACLGIRLLILGKGLEIAVVFSIDTYVYVLCFGCVVLLPYEYEFPAHPFCTSHDPA